MKKFLKIIGLVLGVILFLMLVLPFLFKDKIAAEAEKALNENLDAKIVFDASKVSLSLFRNFPDFSLEVQDFGLINKAPFEGDTLLFAGRFHVVLDLFSVISGAQMKISDISLQNAKINLLVLPNGKSNYDIAKTSPDTAAPKPEGEPSKFSLSIKHWNFENIDFQYFDARTGTAAGLIGLKHSGKGDFTQDLVDLATETSIKDLSVTADSVNYLKHKEFNSKMALKWDMLKKKGEFGDNFVQLNQFKFSFSGWFDVGGPKPAFDLKYATNENNLKDLISLIPAFYAKDFEKLNADGDIKVEGWAKGTYDSLSLPGFETRLLVKKGKIQYPDLPKGISDMEIDFMASHAQGPLETLVAELKNFGMKLGDNPFQASGKVEGLNNPNVEMKANGSLNLAEVMAIYPMEGIQLKGLLNLALQAKGQYVADQKLFPGFSATVGLKDGYVKSKDFPEAIEAIQLAMNASNLSGKMSATLVNLENMSFNLANEPFTMKAKVQDLNDIRYEVAAKGKVDLEKMTQIFPLQGMKLKGKMIADIQTAGLMSDVTAKRYDKLPTSGLVELAQFQYESKDFTKPIAIPVAKANFNSKEMKLENMQMAIGESDFTFSGAVKNHLGYVLKNETLQGSLNMTSKNLNVNELSSLTGEAKPATEPAKEAPMSPVALPKNIDFGFTTQVEKVVYDNLVLSSMKGGIALKNGVLNLKGLQFQTLDGSIKMDGAYDPSEIASPRYDFKMDMQNISVSKAYTAFNTLQTMAPAAKNIEGKFTTSFLLNGKLNSQMKPDLPTANGGGLIKFNEGQVKDLKIMEGINKLAKTKLPTETSLKDVQIKAIVKDGRVFFEPFNVKVGSQVVNLGGSNGLDGTIDYLIKTSVSAGAAGAAVAGVVSQFTGKSMTAPKEIKFDIVATGPGISPKYRIVKVDAGESKDQAKAAINEKANQLKAEAEAKARAEADKLKREAEAKAKAEADRLKKEAEDKAKQELEKLKKKFRF
jgi:hypothetical protein